ncbi:MAG: DUF1080 domain-containing protein [Gemmatimonadota bacterium]
MHKSPAVDRQPKLHRLLMGLGLALFIPVAAPRIPVAQPAPLAPPAIVGRWDLTVRSTGGSYPSWLEVELSGNSTLVGRFVGQFGSARPVSRVDFKDGALRFAIPPQWERGAGDLTVEASLEGGKLSGFLTDPAGVRSPFTAVRAPALRHDEPAWGSPVALFNGKDLNGWKATGANQWKVVNGILTSPAPGSNLLTDQRFTDFRLHVEFRVPKGGNSGIYLRGRYEVQVEDSKGMELDSHHLGGVYGFLTPNRDAALGPGEWQSADITLVGRLVTVVLNGVAIIVEQEIPGITGGALDSDEASPGPLMLQGDHTAIEYRKVVLTPPR